MKVVDRFKSNPTLYYAMSIAATWAGVGSLMNGITIARTNGIVPFWVWTFGNTIACIAFVFATLYIPKLREVYKTPLLKLVMGLLGIFQIWLNMNGIQSIFADTIVGGTGGTIIALVVAAFFIIILFKRGMIRNVLTDHYGWAVVYGLCALITVIAAIQSRGNFVDIKVWSENATVGDTIWKAILLVPGPFMIPYYYELLDYNKANTDGTSEISVKKVFTLGGLLFGLYMLFPFFMSYTNFSPVLNLVKACLVTLIAISSLSSFLYSEYLTFGRKIGLGLNIAAVAFWQLLIPLGVMGMWTVAASVRIYIVIATIAAAVAWYVIERRK